MKAIRGLQLCAFLAAFASGLHGCRDERRGESMLEVEMEVPPPRVNLVIRNYCPTASGRSLRELFVSNFSVKAVNGKAMPDSDRDGIEDSRERELAPIFDISPYSADTNLDLYGDLLTVLAGIQRDDQARLRCPGVVDANSDGMIDLVDADGDVFVARDPFGSARPQWLGLTDCEEARLAHTDPAKFDTDGDDIPDYLELRCGLNPLNPSDAAADTDGDGLTNLEECKRNTPVAESNHRNMLKAIEYRYQISVEDGANGQCSRMTVSQIPILSEAGDNLVTVHLIESDGSEKYLHTSAIEVPANAADGDVFELDFSSPGVFSEK